MSNVPDGPPKERDITAGVRHQNRTRTPNLRKRWVRSRRLSDHEVLQGIRARMAELYSSGRIRVEGGREIFADGAREAQDRLFEERHCIWKRLGASRIPGGFDYQIHLNGVAYGFSPFLAYEIDFLDAFNRALPTPYGPRRTRERIVWLLWRFKGRADTAAGPTANKVRSPIAECTTCEYKHRVASRTKSRCPKCQGGQYRCHTRPAKLRPLGWITRAWLRRRFKLTRYQLDSILAFSLPPIQLPVDDPDLVL